MKYLATTLIILLSHSFASASSLMVTTIESQHWNKKIAYDSLSRRVLGLRWQVNRIWPKENRFVVVAEKGLEITDERLYQLEKKMSKDPWVLTAKASYTNQNFTPPNPKAGLLPIDDPNWHLGQKGINVWAAWQMFQKIGKRPGEGVMIGLTDTGYLRHPELFKNGKIFGLRVDLQKNFSEPEMRNALDICYTLCGLTFNKTMKLAYVGHGTTVASLIISPKNPASHKNYDVVGASPYSEVIPIRVSSSVVLGPKGALNLAKGILYAKDKGAKVITISMGGGFIPDDPLHHVIKKVTASGVIIIAAAGNGIYGHSASFFRQVAKPGAYKETIAVAGSTYKQTPWRDSARGEKVDISAPAKDIRRARAGWVSLKRHVMDTDRGEGTSMAAALAASAAALWVSYHGYDRLLEYYDNKPAYIPKAFRYLLKNSGVRTPPNWDVSQFGAGILDVKKVLMARLPTKTELKEVSFDKI